MRRLLIILGITAAITLTGFFASCGIQSQLVQFTPELLFAEEQCVPITINMLSDAYRENAVKADMDYFGRCVTITGVLDEIILLSNGTPVLGIVLPDRRDYGVVVEMQLSEREAVSVLHKGDTITVSGRVARVFGSSTPSLEDGVFK